MNVQLITGIVTLSGLGILFGIILAVASKVFHVEKDPRVEKIDSILPQANCGGCGYPGCAGYAEAVVRGEASIDKCAPGGQETVEQIAEILGVEATASEPKVAVVRCQGSRDKAKDKYEYHGVEDCNAAVLLANGSKACIYGCLGLGSCVKACPFDAMYMQENGLPFVIEEKCTACGNCVEACPKGIMELIPRSQEVFLGCVNQDRGKAVKDVCSVGCTGCTLCTKPKITPSGKLVMENNMPKIPSDWTDWENAVLKCPAKSFVVRDVAKDKYEKLLAEAEAEKAAKATNQANS